jgi:hypothetical protein
MRLPVDRRSKDCSRAAFEFKNDRWAVIEAMFVLIESGIRNTPNYLPH